MDRNLALVLAGVINAMFVFGSLFPTFFLDKYGRRKPMMWGSFGLGVSMMLVAILLSFQGRGSQDPIAKATSSASVAFFFTVGGIPIYVKPCTDVNVVHAYFWSDSKLYPMVTSPYEAIKVSSSYQRDANSNHIGCTCPRSCLCMCERKGQRSVYPQTGYGISLLL